MIDVTEHSIAAIYTRVSTKKQKEKGESLKTQKGELEKWAKKLKLIVPEEYKYSDSSSGITAVGRTEFERMITDAKLGRFKYIIVLDDDRLGRDEATVLSIVDDLKKKGVYILIYNLQHIDIYKPEGRLLFQNKASFAEYFSNQLKIKIKLSQKHKKETGQWVGRAPYGYKVHTSKEVGGSRKTELIIDESEQEVIKTINDALLADKDEDEIVTVLDEKKFGTRVLKYKTKRTGIENDVKWNRRIVRNIIEQSRKSYKYNTEFVFRNGEVVKVFK